MSLLAMRLMWFGNSSYSLGADARKDLSPYIAVWLLGTLNIEQDSDRNIVAGIYFSIRSLRYTDAIKFSTLSV